MLPTMMLGLQHVSSSEWCCCGFWQLVMCSSWRGASWRAALPACNRGGLQSWILMACMMQNCHDAGQPARSSGCSREASQGCCAACWQPWL